MAGPAEGWDGAHDDEPGVVLLVDDSRAVRVVVERLLVQRGLAVRSAEDRTGAAALDARGAALALLDLELPDGTGVDVAVELRARSGSLPVAFLTSAPRSALADQARTLGPVFEKGGETEDAVAWAVVVAAPRVSG